jgi:cyclopropane-fatty-acyl-phospholipid synthase
MARPHPLPVPDATADAVESAAAVLAELFGPAADREFRVRYWDGTVDGPAASHITIRLDRPEALRRMLLAPSELSIDEAYLRGDFDVKGSLEAATDLAC